MPFQRLFHNRALVYGMGRSIRPRLPERLATATNRCCAGGPRPRRLCRTTSDHGGRRLDRPPLDGLAAASSVGELIVKVGIFFAVVALFAAAAAFLESSAMRRDQWGSTARALLTFAFGLVLVGALVAVAVPFIQTADPARIPPTPTPTPTPSSTDSGSPNGETTPPTNAASPSGTPRP